MPMQTLFVPAAEAAFIGGVSTQKLNRLVDEELVPSSLLSHDAGTRKFARLTAAFAKFFFETEDFYSAQARKAVVRELTQRVDLAQRRLCILTLDADSLNFDWTYHRPEHGSSVDIAKFIAEAYVRNKAVADAERLIVENQDVMNGLPCFVGTRVPIDMVLPSVDAEVEWDRLLASYPFLTQAHIDAARVYAQVHPRRGRPRRLVRFQPMHAPRMRQASSTLPKR